MSTYGRHITINGKKYNVIKDTIDKVIDGDNVGLIIANNGSQYWTADLTTVKDPRMLFHPGLIKLVMEGRNQNQFEFNTSWIEDKLNINTDGFDDDYLCNLKVIWLPAGTRFNIVFDALSPEHQMEEQIIVSPNTWIYA
jgi:hypothetical protein